MIFNSDLWQGGISVTGAPTLVCLHGFMGSAEEWQPVLERLPPARRQNVLCANLPLEYPESIDDIGDYSRWLLQQLPPLESPLVLLGYSLGSRIAMHWLRDAPQRILGAVLEAGHPGLPGDQAGLKGDRLDNDRQWQQRFVNQPLSQTLEQWYRQALFSGQSQQRMADILNRYRGREAALGRMLYTLSVAKQQDISPALGEHPVLYLSGSRDAKYVAIGQQLVAQHARVLQQSIAGAGHNCHDYDPDAVAACVTRFLDKYFPIDNRL